MACTTNWTNRQTGKQLQLGNGPEVEFDIGLPDQNPVTLKLRVTKRPAAASGATGEAVFELVSDDGAATVTVTYRWDAVQPVLRKFVTIKNTSSVPWDRLLNVRLGTYRTEARLSGGELEVYPPSFRSRAAAFGGLRCIGATVRPGGCSTATRCLRRASRWKRPAPATCRHHLCATASRASWIRGTYSPRMCRGSGTDSLGVWLSHWGGWNSGIGTRRWEPGLVMDICRGSALAQPWSDPAWLSPPERRQMGEFIALMKARPQCFVNSRLILGDPWRYEPYGYCCTDGHTAFLALNNGTWQDQSLTLRLGPPWGLPNAITWDLYRWYPHPARLRGEGGACHDGTVIALRPFEVVLLEAVPQGKSPALPR